jgi:predicted HTH transcriptional regulator
MIKIHSTADIETLSETIEVECKLAAGKDGKGVLPKDFWESYSAFANSYGGEIFLGIGESSGPLDIMASIAAPATEKKKLPKKEKAAGTIRRAGPDRRGRWEVAIKPPGRK